MALPQLDIDHLSPDERIRLGEELWNSLHSMPGAIPLTPAQEDELDRRLDEYRQNREPGEPWREALDRIGKNTD